MRRDLDVTWWCRLSTTDQVCYLAKMFRSFGMVAPRHRAPFVKAHGYRKGDLERFIARVLPPRFRSATLCGVMITEVDRQNEMQRTRQSSRSRPEPLTAGLGSTERRARLRRIYDMPEYSYVPRLISGLTCFVGSHPFCYRRSLGADPFVDSGHDVVRIPVGDGFRLVVAGNKGDVVSGYDVIDILSRAICKMDTLIARLEKGAVDDGRSIPT